MFGRRVGTTLSVLALFLLTLSAGGSTSSPDYSKEALLEVFRDDDRPRPEAYKHIGPGYVQFRALGSDFRLFFLPIMAPLAGTFSSTSPTPMIDPFEVMRTDFPSREAPLVDSSKDSSWRERLYARKMRKATLKANGEQ